MAIGQQCVIKQCLIIHFGRICFGMMQCFLCIRVKKIPVLTKNKTNTTIFTNSDKKILVVATIVLTFKFHNTSQRYIEKACLLHITNTAQKKL